MQLKENEQCLMVCAAGITVMRDRHVYDATVGYAMQIISFIANLLVTPTNNV